MTLQAEGFATRVYADGEAALKALTDNPADLVVSDIKMPRMNGLELLEKLRAVSDMPVIMLTSKDDEADEALGLELGADDYITKPFSPTLLVARIRAILRRATVTAKVADETPDQEVVRGDLLLDAERHRVVWRDRDVKLTVTEFLILEALAQRPGVVKTRNQLLDAAYGDDGFVDDRTIDSHIKRIRRKFRQADGDFDGIKTLYGAGYRFAAD
jgi:two-component system response regulator ChvI